MTLHVPLWTQGASHDADVLRSLTKATLVPGVPADADLAVSQRAAGANMSVDIAPGRVVIADYLCWSDAILNLAIDAPPGAGLQRIDSIQAKVVDPNDGTGAWSITVVKGTSSGSPTPPAITGNAVELARVALTSSTVSITAGAITDRRLSAKTAPYRSVLPPSGPQGQVVSTVSGDLAVRDGSGWAMHYAAGDWPLIASRTVASLDVAISAGAFGGGGYNVSLPNRDVYVVANLTGQVSSISGTVSLVDVSLRVQGTGFLAESGKWVQACSTTGGIGYGNTIAMSLFTYVPATASLLLTTQASILNETARFKNTVMTVQVFPA